MTEPPAQLRTSWAKSVGSESSWGFGVSYQKNSPGCCPRRVPYNHAAVDADDKVEPRLDGELRVGVAQHLEPKGAVVLLGCRRRVAIEARYEAIEGVEHGVAAEWLEVVRVLLCCSVAVPWCCLGLEGLWLWWASGSSSSGSSTTSPDWCQIVHGADEPLWVPSLAGTQRWNTHCQRLCC